EQGVEVLTALGGGAYFASVRAQALRADEAAVIAPVVRVNAVRTDWKLHPDYAGPAAPAWALPAGRGVEGKAPAEADPIVAACVVLHRDADLVRDGAAAVRAQGGRVVSFVASVNTVVAELAFSRVRALAESDAVMFIEPPLPALASTNAENRVLTGVETVQGPPLGLTGAGVRVMVYDGGRVFAHPDFAGRLTIGLSDTAPVSSHATHVAGTVASSGAQSAGQHRGMAPGAEVISYGFEGELLPGFLYTDPGDLESDYAEAIGVYGAEVSNNSIGTNTASNGYPCEWEGDYGVTSALVDAIVTGSLGAPIRVVWANGNERSGAARCGAFYHTTPPPVCAKNPIAVGAVNSDSDQVTFFSSWGPTDDDRMKPDVVGPGCQGSGGTGVTSTWPGGGYSTLCGTSMSAPTVAGIVALMLEGFRVSNPFEPDPANSTIKAALAHTAADIGAPGPDYQSGYGSVRAPGAVDIVQRRLFREATIDHGGVWAARLVVEPGQATLRVTGAWDDPAAAPSVVNALVNDLDIVLVSPSGARFLPWTLRGLDDPAAPAVRTAENRVDNLEQVLVDAPEPGVWTVEVIGHGVPEGPQRFSVVAPTPLLACSDSGVIVLGATRASCESSVLVKVIDCGLDADPAAGDRVSVRVSSDAAPPGIVVDLAETGPSTGEFAGVVTLSASGAAGALAVSPGGTVEVEYLDEDTDGAGGGAAVVLASLRIDCTGPAITGVEFTQVDAFSATVSFMTDEPARGSVRFGTACGALTDEAPHGVLRTRHQLRLTGLEPQTSYALKIIAVDGVGNGTTDDAAGLCYSFTTAPKVEPFTELFDAADNDLAFRSVLFVPDGSPDHYAACASEAEALPVDPSTATQLELPDDVPPVVVALTGAPVRLYGVAYDALVISPNGYINFTAADDIRLESVGAHLAIPRVSMLMDDLDPSAGGSVSYQEMDDRFVVSFVGVPQFGQGDANTFQCELFHDGRVRLTYLELGAVDGLAGLSDGSGQSPEFVETDLSVLDSGCGPRPPLVLPVSAATPAGASVEIDLIGSDDGLPAPGALVFVIQSLPTEGVLVDPVSGAAITAAPHELVGSGRRVVYAPRGLYQGGDSFQYAASDGGSAPEGGLSRDAGVTIEVGGIVPVQAFLFDDSDPGFAGEGGWAFGIPLGRGGLTPGGGVGLRDPTSGFTGSRVLGYNLGGNFRPFLDPPEHLTTPPMDFAALPRVLLEFRRWLGVGPAPFDRAAIEVSSDDQPWTPVWENSGTDIRDSSWKRVELDLTPWAAGRSGVRVRWAMGPTDDEGEYCGWNLDDIVVKGLVPIPPCPGDANFDRVVDFDDVTAVLSGWGSPGATRREGDTNDDQVVDFEDIQSIMSNWLAECALPGGVPLRGGASAVR
ncbi:MAG TPA: hypothetical protein DEB06_09725, partial [Phycisphaerales bacterium]|nr:hypothetical protein [Phycisphaerales bacterium]